MRRINFDDEDVYEDLEISLKKEMKERLDTDLDDMLEYIVSLAMD